MKKYTIWKNFTPICSSVINPQHWPTFKLVSMSLSLKTIMLPSGTNNKNAKEEKLSACRNGDSHEAPVSHILDLVPPETPFLDTTTSCNGSSMKSDRVMSCSVSRLLNFFAAIRILPSEKSACCWRSPFCMTGFVTLICNSYYVLAVLHTVLWVAEVLAGFGYLSDNSSLNNLKYVLFNARYGFMVFKSAFLFFCLRFQNHKITALSKAVAAEFMKCRKTPIIAVTITTGLMIGILLVLSILWEVGDILSWGDPTLYDTVNKEVPILVFKRDLRLYQVLSVWYTLGTPLNIVMNIGMIFFAMMVLSLYCCWRELNHRLKHDPVYLMGNFEAEWDQLRRLAEQADDHFSMAVFICWVADIVCAVGYLGSVVIYGGGEGREQFYTVLGFFIHAVWYPGCYLIPCILFDEEMMSTRQLVMTAVHAEMQCQRNTGTKDHTRLLHLNLLLEIVSYRPVAFTAWKFFYITRNVILTISTIMVSYALVLVQLVGRKLDIVFTNTSVAIQSDVSERLNVSLPIS